MEHLSLSTLVGSVRVAIYFWLNERANRMHALQLKIPVDDVISYVPEWEFIYILSYPVVLMPILLISGRYLFRGVALAVGIIGAVSFFFFYFMPVRLHREEYPAPAGFAGALLKREKSIDLPNNYFPGLHVSLAAAASWAVVIERLWPALLLPVLNMAMVFSTMFIKRRYFVDVLAEEALALLVCLMILGKAGGRLENDE